MCRLGLPPSKFLVSILNYIGCELVHLNLNAISTLSFFCMLCECCLRIPPDTSLFWYFYSPIHYEHKVFFGIRLMPRRNHWREYLKVTFRGYWKGASRWLFHINLGGTPQWPNKYLLPPQIEDKRKSPEETPRLKVLVKWVTELHQLWLEVFHCTEEFILQ
jgi:hypothetical protein